MKAELLEKIESVDPSLRDVFNLMLEEVTDQSRLITIGRADFEDLKTVVRTLVTSISELTQAQARTDQSIKDLTQAQARTEARVDTLATRMEELTEAQARTEARVDTLAIRIEELTEAQARTDQSIKDLTQAQARTDQSIKALTQAQARTDKRMEELTHAQKQTEIALSKLSDTVVDMRKQLGGLAMDVGYGIEDRLMPHLPAFCERLFGIRVDVVDRRYIVYADGRHDEANLYVEGEKDGRRVTLIGECKAQPGKRDFDRFAGLLGRVRETRDEDVLGMMAGYQYPPEVAEYARANYPNIPFFKTFEVARG
jgi:predicted nuclease with TOPRIM domain